MMFISLLLLSVIIKIYFSYPSSNNFTNVERVSATLIATIVASLFISVNVTRIATTSSCQVHN